MTDSSLVFRGIFSLDLAKGRFEEGSLFSFKMKLQVSETRNVFAVGAVCFRGVCVEP